MRNPSFAGLFREGFISLFPTPKFDCRKAVVFLLPRDRFFIRSREKLFEKVNCSRAYETMLGKKLYGIKGKGVNENNAYHLESDTHCFLLL